MHSTLTPESVEAPFEMDERGAARLKGSSFPMEGVILEWNAGASPETIARAHPSLTIQVVYATIAYYLGHRDEIDRYLSAMEEEAGKQQDQFERLFPPRLTSEVILRRWAERHASDPG